MNSLFISAAGVVTVLNTVLSAVFYALLAALAISFHTYIKKYTNGINLGSGQAPEYDAQQNAVPVPPVAPVTSEMPTEGIQPPVQQPIDFQPKSVDFAQWTQLPTTNRLTLSLKILICRRSQRYE